MKPALIIHGGAWDWPDSTDVGRHAALADALQAGYAVLRSRGSAVDAVQAAVELLEDAPLFDAGIGSHLNAEGVVEMDALLVDGTLRDFGAVAACREVRHPIALARHILQDTTHNFIVGPAADRLAQRFGLATMANLAFVTDDEMVSFRQQQRRLAQAAVDASGTADSADTASHEGETSRTPASPTGHDTVGALALDMHGNMASATSTGGTPSKMAGRVGDSPLYGAGGDADSRYGAAGATGHGEQIMRVLLSHRAVSLMEDGASAMEAALGSIRLISERIEQPRVGLITLDVHSRVSAAHTTPKIALGWIDADGQPRTAMHADALIRLL